MGGAGACPPGVLVVPRAEKRHVRFEEVNVEQPGPVAVRAQATGGLLGQEGWFAQVFGKACGLFAAEGFSLFRLEPLGEEERVIIRSSVSVATGIEIGRVAVFSTDPLLESVLGKDLVAQMPFAEVPGEVATRLQQFRQTRDVRTQRDVVFGATAGVGAESGEERGPRGVHTGWVI